MIIIQLDSEQLSNIIENSVRRALSENLKPVFETSVDEHKLLTIKQAAEFLNLSVPTVYSKVSRGELPVMKRSKRLYFSKAELLDYIKGGRKKTNSEIESEALQSLVRKQRRM